MSYAFGPPTRNFAASPGPYEACADVLATRAECAEVTRKLANAQQQKEEVLQMLRQAEAQRAQDALHAEETKAEAQLVAAKTGAVLRAMVGVAYRRSRKQPHAIMHQRRPDFRRPPGHAQPAARLN